MIRVRDLVFDYPGHRALDGLSFNIDAGSVVALVGPNGAGKTTLMRCIAALDTPGGGNIQVDGIDALEAPRELHRRIGFLQDFFGLYEDLSVRQCLTYQAMARGVARAERDDRVQATAQRLGLVPWLDKRAGTLSRGWRQRLGIAQALVHEPAVVLLDEPAAGLDPAARRELSDLLVQIAREGTTLIVSSHILTELADYSTHVLILAGGQLVSNEKIDQAIRAARRVMRLRLTRPDPNVENLLRDLNPVAVDALQFEFTLDGGDEAASALLTKLVTAGVPVAELGAVEADLERLYLERVRGTT
ncbi:ABC transporter ATP-binding protein [Roseiterribacter gracilis]|uniref:ABC transporter n=1 Tax=Roseiterribacter gracilis TaxID=2812848 RepID=A0A8S8XCT8_9PROT|nr:ABC transporter [Rhodospirillales bacterium TMPK1]